MTSFLFLEGSYDFGYPIWLDAEWNAEEKTFINLQNDMTFISESFLNYKAVKEASRDNNATNLMAIGRYDKEGKFSVKPGIKGTSKGLTVCRTSPKVPKGIQTINTMLDPSQQLRREQEIQLSKREYHSNFKEMNISRSYDHLFELLWYTRLPCFDVKGISSEIKDESSMIKRCYWRGKMVDCGQIFVARPSDRGMCCAFNFDNAEKIFKKTLYTDSFARMQNKDKSLRFTTNEDRYV